jgi:hypothetical protein
MRTGPAAVAILTAAIATASFELASQPATDAMRGPTITSTLLGGVSSMLAEWIRQSRDAAIADGVELIPEHVRAALSGYVPTEVLDRVHWRVGGSGETSLQQQLFRFEYSPAVTLDHVVVFQHREAVNDPKLWVHELKHVMQYQEWGIDGFAARYIADYEAVEHDAAEYRWEWMKREGLVPIPSTASAD